MADKPKPWWQQLMMGLDFETTGINVATDRIVTGCAAMLVPRDPPPWDVRPRTWFVNPGIPIHEKATEVHGITDAMAQEKGTPPAAAILEIANTVAQAVRARIPIVGMNLPYDLTMLWHEGRRYGVDLRAACPDGVWPVIDVYVLDKHIDPYRKGPRKLVNLCEHYGVRIDGAHDSTFDALAAARIAYRIGSRVQRIGDATTQQLHQWQVEWRKEQSAGLQKHFRKTDPKATCDPCWPICYHGSNER